MTVIMRAWLENCAKCFRIKLERFGIYLLELKTSHSILAFMLMLLLLLLLLIVVYVPDSKQLCNRFKLWFMFISLMMMK